MNAPIGKNLSGLTSKQVKEVLKDILIQGYSVVYINGVKKILKKLQ